MSDALRRRARWILCAVAAAAAVAAARTPNRPRATALPPRVIAAPPDIVRARAAAGASANRFLTLYLAASDGHLSAGGRRALAAASASEVADVLLEQPPERLRRGGRLLRLVLGPADGGTLDAVATLDFERLTEAVRLTVARYPDGSWRVTMFEPSVAAPNRRAAH